MNRRIEANIRDLAEQQAVVFISLCIEEDVEVDENRQWLVQGVPQEEDAVEDDPFEFVDVYVPIRGLRLSVDCRSRLIVKTEVRHEESIKICVPDEGEVVFIRTFGARSLKYRIRRFATREGAETYVRSQGAEITEA